MDSVPPSSSSSSRRKPAPGSKTCLSSISASYTAAPMGWSDVARAAALDGGADLARAAALADDDNMDGEEEGGDVEGGDDGPGLTEAPLDDPPAAVLSFRLFLCLLPFLEEDMMPSSSSLLLMYKAPLLRLGPSKGPGEAMIKCAKQASCDV